MRPAQTDHESFHRALVERMVAELRPVRRLWPVRVRLMLWVALEAAVLLLLICGDRRTDLAEQLRSLRYVLGVSGFAAAGVIAAAFALRAAIPGREPGATEIGVLMVVAAAPALLLFAEPIDAKATLGSFIAGGLPCAAGIAVFATVPCLALLWAVKRGAPLAAGFDGALSGCAAFLFSFGLTRLKCPVEEGMHLLVWHLLPALAGIALSACIGTVLFRRRVRDSEATPP